MITLNYNFIKNTTNNFDFYSIFVDYIKTNYYKSHESVCVLHTSAKNINNEKIIYGSEDETTVLK